MSKNLALAVKSRDVTLVKEILQSNKPAASNAKEVGEILWHAVLDDEMEIASMLVRAGADLQVRMPHDIMKKSFLHYLVNSLDPRHHRLAMLMIDYDADVNVVDARANGIISYAIKAHHSAAVEIVKKLLEHDARVSDLDISEATSHPLLFELLPLLFDAGTPSQDIKCERAFLMLKSLSFNPCNESEILPTVTWLLNMNLPLTDNQMSLLLVAVIAKDKVKMVRLLMKHYRIDFESCIAHTLLYYAGKASIEMIKLLLRHGLDCNRNYNGTTLLARMTYPGYLNDKYQLIIKHLVMSIAKGSNISMINRKIIDDHVEMKEYFELCTSELEFMQLLTVFNDITFFSILTSDIGHLSFLTRNDNFVQSYKNSTRKNDFPIYYDELEEVFNMAEERKEKLLETEETVCEELDDILPDLPLQKVIRFLYLDDDV